MALRIGGWSLSQVYRKCGKPFCRTCSEGRGHGPYWYGTRTENGKRTSKYFGATLPEFPENQNDIKACAHDQDTEEIVRLRELLARAYTEIQTLRRENARLRAMMLDTFQKEETSEHTRGRKG